MGIGLTTREDGSPGTAVDVRVSMLAVSASFFKLNGTAMPSTLGLLPVTPSSSSGSGLAVVDLALASPLI